MLHEVSLKRFGLPLPVDRTDHIGKLYLRAKLRLSILLEILVLIRKSFHLEENLFRGLFSLKEEKNIKAYT